MLEVIDDILKRFCLLFALASRLPDPFRFLFPVSSNHPLGSTLRRKSVGYARFYARLGIPSIHQRRSRDRVLRSDQGDEQPRHGHHVRAASPGVDAVLDACARRQPA